MTNRTAIFGIFPNGFQAQRAVAHLLRAGFSNDSISVLLPDYRSTKPLAHERHSKAPEGAVAGATVSGFLGAIVGVFVGAGAPLVFPGSSALLAAGPIVGALAGLGAAGAIGGIIGAMFGSGIPEFEAKRYDQYAQAGGILLSAHCETHEQIESAEEVLKAAGADDIVSTEEEGRKAWPPVLL